MSWCRVQFEKDSTLLNSLREELRKALVQSFEAELGFMVAERDSLMDKRDGAKRRLEAELAHAQEEVRRLREQVAHAQGTAESLRQVSGLRRGWRGCQLHRWSPWECELSPTPPSILPAFLPLRLWNTVPSARVYSPQGMHGFWVRRCRASSSTTVCPGWPRVPCASEVGLSPLCLRVCAPFAPTGALVSDRACPTGRGGG
jgi:hypothetical protein